MSCARRVVRLLGTRAMFVRFAGALSLVVLISLAGTHLDKRSLDLRRRLTRQHFYLDVLEQHQVAARVEAQRLGAPTRLIDSIEQGELEVVPPQERDNPRSKDRSVLRPMIRRIRRN